MELIYYPTHTRMSAWLIGVAVGYALHYCRHRRCVMPMVHYYLLFYILEFLTNHFQLQFSVVIGWTVSIGTMLAIIFGNFPLQQFDHIASVWEDAAYTSLSRVGWSLALGWIIFACVHGYGGPVNWFLSAAGWQPLARLSYCIYIVHLPVQIVLGGRMRMPGYFSDTNAVIKEFFFLYIADRNIFFFL